MDYSTKPSIAIMIANKAKNGDNEKRDKLLKAIGSDLRKALENKDDTEIGKVLMASHRAMKSMLPSSDSDDE